MTFGKMDKQTIAFILLIIISSMNPDLIYNLNKWFIGQLIILIVIIYFSCHNMVLGLLTIFLYFIILDRYKYVIEGMTGGQKIITPDTVGEIKRTDEIKLDDDKSTENKPNKNKIIISTGNINSNGIDIQDIRDSIASKDSNSFPLSKNMFKSSDDVEPFNIR